MLWLSARGRAVAHVVEGRGVGGDEREGGLAEHFGFVVFRGV